MLSVKLKYLSVCLEYLQCTMVSKGKKGNLSSQELRENEMKGRVFMIKVTGKEKTFRGEETAKD